MLQGIIKELKGLCNFSKNTIKIGILLCLCYYILSAVLYITAPISQHYLYYRYLLRGTLEAAPACLAAGVVAALIADLAIRNAEKK